MEASDDEFDAQDNAYKDQEIFEESENAISASENHEAESTLKTESKIDSGKMNDLAVSGVDVNKNRGETITSSSIDSSERNKLDELKDKMSIVGTMQIKSDRKVLYKAYAVAILDQDHIPLALNNIEINDEKFITAKCTIMAFRINAPQETVGKPHI